MKLIIVDDEPAVRGSIRMLANPEILGFTTVEEASDGQEALKKLEKTKFDVMITDMRMPGMDGIGLLNSIREDELPTTIVVSAYHDFEYMRLAMHKHAVDYLLKPIKQVELIAALRRAACVPGRSTALPLSDRLSSLWWPISGYPKKELIRTLDAMLIGDGKCNMLFFRCFGFKNVLKQKYGNSKELMYYYIEQSIADFCSKEGFKQDIVILGETAEILVLLHDLGKFNSDFLREIENAIITQTGVLSFCEQILIKPDFQSIFSSYEALRRKIGKRAWDPSNGQLCAEHGEEAFSVDCLAKIRDLAEHAVQYMDIAMLSKNIREWEVMAFDGMKPSILALEGLASVYLKGLMEGLGRAGTSLVDALDQFEDFPSLCCWLSGKNALIAWMEAVGKVCIDHSFSVKRKKCSHVIKSMLDYVEKNYTLDIGLDDLTKHFHMSREHISRLFKKETGENFISYLTRLRMKKAAGLISEARHSMQMVAESIGFNDASYFSRSFKKYYGISPEDYRRKYPEGNPS